LPVNGVLGATGGHERQSGKYENTHGPDTRGLRVRFPLTKMGHRGVI
jgi:hypothetical protein